MTDAGAPAAHSISENVLASFSGELPNRIFGNKSPATRSHVHNGSDAVL